MDNAQLIITMMGAGGGGAALLAFVNGLWKWFSGASAREREKNTQLTVQRQTAVEARIAAEAARDLADIRRRHAEEYAAMLRRQLLNEGFMPIPPPVPPEKEKDDGNNDQ